MTTERADPAPPKLAVLFWCYKELAICQDRLKHLRRESPSSPIYLLFGGEPEDAPLWERGTKGLVDDFYAFDGEPPAGFDDDSGYRGGAFWKYVHGDFMFTAWYRDRGVALAWDAVVVVQWDMLVYGDLQDVFACLRKDEVLFSGLRPVKEVEKTWVWVADTGTKARKTYLEFLDYVRREYGFDGEPLCCLAIVLCFPRSYLDNLSRVPRPELGGLEYRLPIYAQAFGTPICREHPFKPWWGAVEPSRLNITLRARPVEIFAPTIFWNLRKKDGARVFHPYWRRVPHGFFGWSWALLDALPRLVFTTTLRALVGNLALRVRKPRVAK